MGNGHDLQIIGGSGKYKHSFPSQNRQNRLGGFRQNPLLITSVRINFVILINGNKRREDFMSRGGFPIEIESQISLLVTYRCDA